MDVKIVSSLTSSLLIAKDDFVEQDGYIDKKIKVSGKLNLVLFRQSRDCLELINVTENEMMLVKQVTDHDPQQSEDIALQIYSEVKEQLLNLENKIVDDQGAYKTSEVKNFNNQADEAQLSRKELELDKHEITKQVRIQLKIEGKLGADFAKSANGLSVAQGDYIKLNEAYSQKRVFFSIKTLL